MPFTAEQQTSLLAEKGIGKTVAAGPICIPYNDPQKQRPFFCGKSGKSVWNTNGMALQRLTQMGLDDVEALANADIDEVLTLGAMLTGSSCWKNSPQSRAAIATAIAWAQRQNP